ncbi:extracellular solute-binding protein [Oceanomicrobium pacificus]|uniref:ABC transporter substrate-binding protein n=1 Tax=Oceanomicrobium pacificus TaxID=2692916 RepID=A0A6B0TSM3_9RHOB|nr:extracellular solute-binding protein [Oceanomicrobium pacificus]MXU64202.1 ABC transporter substrate-binding protein [Oceanomicrobium pacificus]
MIAQTQARTRPDPAHDRALPGLFLFGVSALAALVLATDARADGHVTESHGISTYGELKYAADFEHFDYVNPDAPRGGEYSSWAFGSFDSMHPYTIKGRAGRLSSIMFETLMEASADEVDALYGLLAETVRYPEDRQWIEFDLRPEARFSDGSPVTADDVVFSYEILRDKGLPSLKVVFEDFETVEALDGDTVRYTFREGSATKDLSTTAATLPVFSRADWEGKDFSESTLEPGIGSGPYMFDRIDVGQTIVYRRNPDYWGADLPINRGRHNYDTIRLEYYADYNAAFEGFKAGDYTFRTEASSLIWGTEYDFPAVQNGQVVKVELDDGGLGLAQGFFFNLRREKFQDPRVRQAIGMMFNFEWSNQTLFYGLYDRVTSFWENSDLKATGLPDAAELALLEPLRDMLPDSVFTEEAVVPPVSAPSQLDRKLVRAAGQLLDAAGWTVVDGQRRNADGDLLSVEILNDSPSFDRIINPFVENLRRIGIDAVHNRIDNAQMTDRERTYDFDMLTDIYGMSLTPGSGLKQYFGSEVSDESVFNKAGLRSEAVDALIEKVLDAESRDEMTVAVRALDRVLRAERIWVPQWYKSVHTVAYYDYYEHPDPLPPYALGSLDIWWANAEKFDALKAEGAF